jgi:quercetin dioxygenase-like cupin family protein
LKSAIFPLQIPLPLDVRKGWTPHPFFRGWTRGLPYLSCHASSLSTGNCPHAPHAHREEELLLLLSGEVDLILPGLDREGQDSRRRLRRGEFVYYPSYFAHTLETMSVDPANYLMLKWQGQKAGIKSQLGFGRYDSGGVVFTHNSAGFCHGIVFEGPTQYLKKLQCHVSTLIPGAGYAPHKDPYDVAIIVLSGNLRTLDRTAGPHSVIFYPAGEPHGMQNLAEETARYIVFEFHSRSYPALTAKLKSLEFWKHEIRHLLNRSAKMLRDRQQ